MSDEMHDRSKADYYHGLLALCAALAASVTVGAPPAPCAARYDLSGLPGAPIEEIAGHPLRPGADYRVDSITVVRQPVFNNEDAAEDNALFRLANRLHIDTKESAVRTLLLFQEGDSVTADTLAESERLLRGKSFLYDARVIANRVCDDRVELVVVTRDVWTLLPSLGASRTGGEQEFEIGVSDINLAGTGAAFDVEVFDNLDRRGWSMGYTDANLAASRVALSLRFEDTDDGGGTRANIGQPFYALDTRRAWNVALRESDFNQGLYDGGRRIASFDVARRFAQVSGGWSRGLVAGFANRLRFGFTLDEWRFDGDASLDLRDRAFAYPWVAFERIENEFSKTRNLNRVEATEDVFLGRSYRILLGHSPRGDGYHIANASYRDGWQRNDDFLLYTLTAGGYWNTRAKRSENIIASADLRYRRRHTPRLALHVNVEGLVADRLTADQQVLLGGDSGMRGYPNRFQTGKRRFRVTAEERYYAKAYLARAVRVAGAAFVDIGRAWSSRDDNDTLANIGLGLRFESTRTDRSIVFHLDVATPLVDAPGVRGVEVTLTSKRSL